MCLRYGEHRVRSGREQQGRLPGGGGISAKLNGEPSSPGRQRKEGLLRPKDQRKGSVWDSRSHAGIYTLLKIFYFKLEYS